MRMMIGVSNRAAIYEAAITTSSTMRRMIKGGAARVGNVTGTIMAAKTNEIMSAAADAIDR